MRATPHFLQFIVFRVVKPSEEPLYKLSYKHSLFIQVLPCKIYHDYEGGEGSLNLQSIVVVSIIFNLSLNAITVAGIGPLTNTVGGQYQLSGNFNSTVGDLTNAQGAEKAIAGAGQCVIPANATVFNYISCNPVITGIQGVLTTVLTFGIFLWGVVNVLPLFAEAILLPGAFLLKFGVDPSIVAIFSIAFTILYVFWGYVLITGRYNTDLP